MGWLTLTKRVEKPTLLLVVVLSKELKRILEGTRHALKIPKLEFDLTNESKPTELLYPPSSRLLKLQRPLLRAR